MYQGFTPILDNNLCSYICDHLRLWSTVHKLYLDRSLQVPWSHTLQPHPFFPQSNGLVERFHYCLKVSLRARLSGTDWFNHLPLVLLGLWSVSREDSANSVSKALFGFWIVHQGSNGSKSDSVFSDQPVISQQPPQRGRPPLALALFIEVPLTLAPLTPALLTPTSPIPLERAKRMKKRV